MGAEPKLILPVTLLELLELQETLPDEIERRDEKIDPDQQGEFLTAAAVVSLTALTIKALSVWLAKNRSRSNRIEESLKIERTDGTVVTHTLSITSASESMLSDDAASALTDLVRTSAQA